MSSREHCGLALTELLDLARAAGDRGPRPSAMGAWRCRRHYGDLRGAFHARLWVRGRGGPAVYVVRGVANGASLHQALRLLSGREPNAWREGLTSVDQCVELTDEELLLTGHSLGGAFASALARQFGLGAFTFSAPGLAGVLPDLDALPGGRAIENLCLGEDWLRLLAGPGLGRDLILGSVNDLGDVRRGRRGLLDAWRKRRLRGEGLASFVRRALKLHGLDALRAELQPDQPWSFGRTFSRRRSQARR